MSDQMSIEVDKRASTNGAFPPQRLHSLLVFLFGLFFLSGFSALVYQIAWQRMLGAFIGSDSVAATIIVGAFLFGLGIGSLIAAAFADRLSLRSALRAFALCEIGIGAFACFSRTMFYDLFLGQLTSVAGKHLASSLIVLLALLPPTTLMGMSLPLLSRIIVDTIDRASARIGWLYGLNTLGAATGALLTGWILIGTFGFAVTVYASAAINFLIGGSALLWSGRLSPLRPLPNRIATEGHTEARNRLLLWSIMVFVSGFLIISLEIVWFRVLGTMMRSNAYAFSLILGIFLLGDGLGIVVGAEVANTLANPRRAFQLLQGVMGIYALLSLEALFAINASTQLSLFWVEGPRRVTFAITLPIVLPPAFLLGMSFPITQRAIQDDPALVGRRVGLVQLCNVLGNAAGAVVTGLVLLHWLGTALTLRLIGVISLAFVLVAFGDETSIGRTELKSTVQRRRDVALVIALLLLIAIFPSNGSFWSALHGTSLAEGAIVVEDRTGVSVLQTREARFPHAGCQGDSIYIAGHAQSCVPFLPVHVVLGVLGAVLHPNPQDIFIIGQGTGGTPIAAGANPRTKHIRVVDIVAPVFDVMQKAAVRSGQDLLHKPIREYYSDPRYTRTAADARHILLTEDTRYDIIQADAILPFTALSGQLYSTNYFRLAKSRLKPGGYVVQWMPTERAFASFLRVFPYVVSVNNFIAIGSAGPIDFSDERLAAELGGPAGEYLTKMGFDRRDVLAWLMSGSRRVWTPDDIRDDRDVNTDLFPKDEYYLNHLKIEVIDPDASRSE
jgi:spermidine synthase